jgi:hypothetical protein
MPKKKVANVEYLEDCEGFYKASAWDMWSETKVNQCAAAVHGGARLVRNLRIDEVNFVLVVLEHL